LTDYDLNDPTTRFSVQLAAYALETQRRLLISAADSPARH
jgi:hypothetical protein